MVRLATGCDDSWVFNLKERLFVAKQLVTASIEESSKRGELDVFQLKGSVGEEEWHCKVATCLRGLTNQANRRDEGASGLSEWLGVRSMSAFG